MVHNSFLNKRIVVTRAEEQSENVAAALKDQGANVILAPVIKVVPADLSPEDEMRVASFYEYDVVIISSINAVKSFFSKVPVRKETFSKPFIIAIGERTARGVISYGFSVDFVPPNFTSKELIKSLSKMDTIRKDFEWCGKKILIPVGNLADDKIANFLRSKGAVVEKVVVYKTLLNDLIDNSVKREINSGKFDAVIFYSPSQVKNFVSIFGIDVLKNKFIATIGVTTKAAVEEYGLPVDVVPIKPSSDDLITAMFEYENF